jgi:hypothetical protein
MVSMILIAQTALGVIIGLAQAAEPTGTLTLACQGTATEISDIDISDIDPGQRDAKPHPVSMGIIVDFKARSVTGFTYPGADVSVTINAFDDVSILFSGSSKVGNWTIMGFIDRVTGGTDVTSKMGHDSTNYSLKCKPTQRMF